ncbi:hypothetical protein [uncultured Sphaerotilus sp.]|uniref:DUF7281 domain-containing protein n=1 Tax=uncultured Sphaerotilus sp. TaxID=474984 RepID=UPI0030CA4537
MPFNAQKILFLQRLVRERPTQRRVGEVSQHFCEHYSLGTMVGRQVEYRDEHHRMAESLLRNHDLPVTPMAAGASRSDVAAFGGLSEKALSAAPHAGSVGIKCIGDCMLNASALRTPEGTYLVAAPEVAVRVTCDRLMLVENLETFRQLERYNWIDYRGLAVLAVYRGDSALSTGDALKLVRTRSEPVWAFVDFDPAGLVIANALPAERLERVVLPPVAWLRKAAETVRGRQLFDEQDQKARLGLDRAAHPDVRSAWVELRKLRSGVTQERMLLTPKHREAEEAD